MKPFYIGIDPGKNGGIVGLTNGKINVIDKMPQTAYDMWDYFIYLGFPNVVEKDQTYVIIEDVHSMPTDGVASAFTFGRHIGVFDGIFAGMGISPYRVRPQIWQQYFGLERNRDDKSNPETKYQYKKRILEMARRTAGQGRNKEAFKSLNLFTADAYLIAQYFAENHNKEGFNIKQ
jgi:crossover junction endodeoxyribonuclease RuvC